MIFLVRLLLVGSFLFLVHTTQANATDKVGDAAKYTIAYTNHAEKFWAKRGGFINCPYGVGVNWAEGSDREVAWSYTPGCNIWINNAVFFRLDPSNRCTIIMHEWGHLIGIHHDPRKWHLMYKYLVKTHPACNKFAYNKKYRYLWWYGKLDEGL